MSGLSSENALITTAGSAREPTGANGKGSDSFDFLGFTLNLGIRDDTHLEAGNPTAHTLAWRRFATLATGTGGAHPWPDGLRTRRTTDRVS
jgi:hypothetical protein